jgi:glycosyltransferase involved in cell wall biosynthesis
MKDPKVSVIIPSYNRFDSLLVAVESVFAQTYKNIEILIINDGSTDIRYKSHNFPKHVSTIHLEENQKKIHGFGPGSIRNFGTELAKGKYLAFLDDDDIWLNQKLELQIKALEESHFKFSSTEGFFGEGKYSKNKEYSLYNKEHYLADLKYKYRKTKYLNKNVFPKVWDEEFLKVHNCVITSSVVVENDLFKILGGFRGLPRWADYDCWLGLVQLSSLLYIDEPLFYYDNLHGEGQEYFK